MYRIDLHKENLILIFQKEHLKWSYKYFTDRLLKDPEDGSPYYDKLDFKIEGKRVHGWAAVLETGSRRDAGFSILQANRVIQGWPDAYRPTKLFGYQEGGINDLVNQRLTGELFLDKFEVSHTKDEILFTDDEEEKLNDKLFELLANFKRAATEYRKPVINSDGEDEVDYSSIVKSLFVEIQSPKIINYVKTMPVLPKVIIEENNSEVIARSLATSENSTYKTTISGIEIVVIINDQASVNDPYLIIRARAVKDSITIILNKNHQHWKSLKNSEMVMYFIKHCILDGLAEWKAWFIVGDIDPDTIKTIKDTYLRLDLKVL